MACVVVAGRLQWRSLSPRLLRQRRPCGLGGRLLHKRRCHLLILIEIHQCQRLVKMKRLIAVDVGIVCEHPVGPVRESGPLQHGRTERHDAPLELDLRYCRPGFLL